MNKYKFKQWFKSLFDFDTLSSSKHPRANRLSVELLEIRLTPDANTTPGFHDLGNDISDNNCPANSIALIDDIRLLQNLTDYRANQVYFCSDDSLNFPASTFQSVNKLDAVALQAASTKGVVIIDSSLVATIPAAELKGSLVISIDSNRDVVSQITTALEGLSDVPVLRIISHGDDGVLYFGNQAFDSTDLTSSAMQVASWGKSLTPDADILLYGCSVANTDAGKAFVQQFASITQADIAASSNLTGIGGDEVLEFQVGQVSNSLIASAIDYYSANLALAQITVTTTADSGAGSLRQAITDANLTSANDEIIFASSLFTNGTSTITLGSGALPVIASTTSAGSLTITGPGASALVINGNNGNTGRNFRIFDIASGGNLSISGVTVSGAKTTSNGAGFSNLGTLTVTNSLISGNSGGNTGGGIYNRGTLNVSGSTFTGNSANYGGGLYISKWSSFGTVSNSTFSSNTAFRHGGGLFNNGTLTITNTTVSGNTSIDTIYGAGIHSNAATVYIANNIIANNINGLDYYGSANLISPATASSNLVTQSGLAWATTVTSAQLNLGPLQNNGGATSTMALGAGSVAIGAGNATVSNASPVSGLDQRGATRSPTAPSIGAFEYVTQVITFSPQTTLSTWNKAGKVITADVNNDGKQDMVVQNIGYGELNNGPRHDYVSVFLGKGDGTFETRMDTNTGSYSNWLGSGDFNGDGKVDFVTPNYCGESISILLGRGDGTFIRQDMSNAGGTTSPSFVITGDVNGDGKIDILTTNQNSSNVSIFLGNGNGTFQNPTLLSTSAIPNRIVLGDFNSDGKQDIVVHTAPGNVPSNTLFLGTGTGSFTSSSIIGITGELTVADFNRDGFADIAGTESNVVKVLLSNGNATFKAAQIFSAPNVGSSIIATDLNGDGFLDLQLPQFYANALAVLNGNGDGSFKAQVNFAVGSNPFTVASADFNRDGKPDTVVSNLNSKNVSVLLNTSNTAPTLAPISVSGTEDNAVTFTAANFTGGTVASPGIAYVGLQADMGAGWRTSSTPKTYDIDGNNVLGSNGWWLPNYTLSSPSYITSFANDSYYSGNGSYALVDNPLTTPGASPSLIYSGTTNGQFPGKDIKSINSVVSFTLTGVVPGTIRVGIMTGNTDASGAFGASGYQIISAPFDSGMTTELQTNGAVYNGNPDWVFFDITGGIAGQTYSIYAKGGPQGNAAIGAISFDSITTTPTYTDAENNPLVSITIATLPASGTLKLSGNNVSAGQVIAAANLGNLTYVPALNENGTKTFTVTASDGFASSSPETTVSLNIAAVNDAPTLSPSRVVVATASASVNANSEVSFSETQSIPPGVTVSGVKVTRDFSTYWPSSNPAYAHVYLKLNGVVVGQLGFNATGTNGAYTSVSTEFFGPLSSYIPGGINTWTIGSIWNPVNLANIKIQLFYADASAPAIVVNGTEDTPLNFTAANFTNAYGDTENNSLATITITTLPATGTLMLSGANVSPGQVISAANLGNLSYVPAPNENGAKTFTVTASDGNSSSAVATVSMNIAAVSDAPAIGGISTSINYISTDFTTAPANATISGSAVVSNGECVLTPAASNQYGYLLFNTLASNPTAFSAQFDYRVADGSGADGTSFNYGVIDSPSGGEWGMTNTGLVVSLIEYGAQRVEIKLNGTSLQTAYVTLIGSNYQRIVVNIDGSNKLSVSVGGVTVVSSLDLGVTYGNADKSTWKFGFASRCGGANNKHSIDNLVISNNVAPLIALEQTSTALADSLTLSDVDNSTLASAVVTIVTGLKTSEDVLGFVANATNYGNITGTYNSSTGALSLISAGATATLAQWQAALRSVTYTNTSDAPDTTNRNVSFVVNDGTVNSAAATVTVIITAVNDAPVANADAYTATEDTPLVVSPGSPVVDQQQTAWNTGLPNDGYQTFTAGQTGFLTSIDLMQNGGASNPQQVTLTVYAGDGIGGVTLGAVTISETNTYNSTLGGFVQTYTFSQPVAIVSGGVYTFKLLSSSNRGLLGSSNTDAYTNGRFYHSGGLTGDLWFRTSVATSQGLLVNDSDAEGNSLTAVIVTNPSNGTVVLNSDGRFTYTPNANFNGTDSFTYKASDGLSFSNVATVTVNVTAANDAPTATIQTIAPTEDTIYSGTLTGSDIDSSALTYSVVTQGTKGVVTITNAATGAFTYVPNANANGSDSFTFKVNDGSLDSAPATVTVNITAVNDAPVANGSATLASINEDYVPVSYNAYNSFVSGPAAQSASNRWQYFGGTTSSLTLLPNWKTDGNEVITSFPQWHQNLSYGGHYPFVQQVTSAYGPVSAGTLVIHPADGGSSVSGAVAIGWKNTSNNTVFVDFGLTLRLPYASNNGLEYFLQRGLVGTARYQSLKSGTITQSNSPVGISSSAPTELQPGEFIYLVVDSRGSYAYDHTEVSNFTVTENANRGATVASLFGANFSDSQDNSANTFAGVAVSSYTVDSAKGNWQHSSNGSTWSNLVSATSSAAITLKATDYLRFVPAANYNGQATALSANLIESGGAAITSGATVNISGAGPQLVLGSSNVIGWSSVYSGAFAADNIVDEQSGSVVADIFGNNYWLASDNTGSASILIDLGVATPLSKIDLYNTTNTGHNDRGTSNFRIEVANSITGGSAVTYSLVSGLTVASGTMAYADAGVAPTAQTFALSSGATAYRYVRFVVDSSKNNNPGLHELRLFGVGSGVGETTVYSQNKVSLNHTITAVNDAPVANAQSISPTEDTTYSGTLIGSDIEGSALTYSVVTQGTKGVFTITDAATGAFTYVPNANANGPDSFTFKVNDGSSDSAPATISVNISAVNDAPVANAQSISPTEDTTYTGTLTGSDIENSSLTYSVVSQGTKGVFTITNAATGAFTYVPNANANGSDSFTFKVNDGSSDSAPATISVNITAVNDAPSNFFATTVTLTPGTGGTITQVGNDYVHTFTTTGASSFVAPNANVSAQVLVVGGGGGGSGGGGGAGGVLYQTNYAIGALQTINIIVGTGGDSNSNRYFASPNGSNGGDSSFGSIIAFGGGGGGAVHTGGSSGASSGGAGFDTAAITGAATQGYAGANGAANDGYVAAGGGGGAGGLGTRGLYGLDGYGWATSSSPGGNGGIGLAYNISGVENYYGGGGGGGANTNSAATTIGGLGGLGGGGDGARAHNGQGIAGIANTGGGGGGGDFEGQGAAGGSGIVIVRYVGATSTTSTTSSIISTIEDTAKSIQGIQITDSDSTNVTVTFTHSAGTLSVDTNVANGLGASAVSGNGTATLVLNGTVAQINATLAASSGLIYTPTANFNGNATLTMTTNDGVGGIDSDTLAMTVTAVNDIPTLTSFTAAVATTNEDTAVEITLADLLAQGDEADVDGSVTAFVIKSVTSGILIIGTSSENATAWNASTNATVDAINKAYWTPVADANGILNAFTAVAKDNNGVESATAITATVNVAAVNDAPVVIAGGTVSYTENSAATVIDAGITITDVDDTTLTSAIVTITNAVTGDVLSFVNTDSTTYGNISGSYSGGVLTLSSAGSTATVAQWQAALRSVTYFSTNENPTVNNTQSNRTITWSVTDVNSSNAANGVLTSDNSAGVSTSYLTGSAQILNANGSNPYIIAVDLGQNWSFEADYQMNSSNGLNTVFSYGNYTDGVLIRTLRGDSLYVNGASLGTINVFGTSNTNGVFVPVKITYTTTGTTGTLSIYASGSLIESVTTNIPLNPTDKTIRLGSAHHSNGEGFDGAVRNIKVTVGAGSATTSTVNILAVNNKPFVTAGATVSYTENAPATVIDAGFTISDADDTTLASATVTITNAVTGDVLGFTNQSGITGSYTNGVLTLSGTATLAQYQAALRSVTYLSTSEDPTVSDTRNNRTITWSVTDSNSDAVGAQTSLAVTSTINITAVNDAPVFQSVIFSENFDALDGNKNGGQYLTNEPVQYNATLPGWTSSGAGALHVVGRGGAGTSNDALMIYHDNKATLTTGISANAAGNIYTVSFDVAPAVYQDAGQVTTASDELRITILNSSGGTLKEFSIAPGAFTADASYRSASFSYVGDGSGDVRIQIDNKTPNNGRFSGAIDNLSITSTGGGSSIRSITDTSATDSFTVINGSLVAADVDANTALTYSIDGGTVVGGTTTKVGTYGTLVLTTSTGAYTYTPNNAAINALTANASESFTFGVSDGTVTTTADLVVNLVAANDTPIVVNIAPVVYTNTNAVDVFANTTGTISASDADANAVLVYGISGQGIVISNGSATLAGQYGTLSIVTATGEYSYAPNQNQLDRLSGDAVDNFTFTISDGTATVNKSFVVNINDKETPTVAISSNVVRLKAGEVANLTFTFTEVPVGFDLNSLNVTGGALSNLVGSGTSYSATFTPTINSNTAGSVSFKANSYKDSANNFGSVATLAPVISVDTLRPLAPVVVLASDTGISATDKVTFAGIVTVSGIEANATWEFSNDNGVNWAPGPIDSTFAFKNDGAKSLFIRQTDAAGNLGPVNEFRFTLDTVAPVIPTLALNTDTGVSALDKITRDGKINVTGLESTAGFEYSLNSGTSWVLGSGNSITLTGDGAKLVRVRQIDLAGNIGAATADLQFTLDTASTTLAVSSNSSKLKAGETATITFTFSETAFNFDYSDISVEGGTLSNLVQNAANRKIVTATFTPLVNSIATGQISVGANYSDAAGNSGTSAVLVPIIAIDTSVPTVEISSGASALKIGETTLVTFSLSESTSDFNLADITVTGGTLSNFAGSNNSYTATFTPTIGSTTTASINVAAGKFADAFANQNLASNALKISVDTSAPVASFARVATPRNTGVSSLDLTFTESVSGFDVSDLSLTFNGNAVSLSGASISGSGANYTISGLNTTAQGAYVLTLNFNASGISDASGNALGANASVSWSVDTSSPAVAITSSTNKLNPGQSATITFTFSTAPTGFDASDITAVGGTISGLTKSSNTVYTATLTPAANFSGKGSVAVSNGYTNAAGTTGLPGLSETIAIDTVAPTAVLSSSVDRLGVGQTSTITFTFSEAVAGFDSADLRAEGGTLGTLSQSGSNPLVFTTTFTPTANFTGKGKVTLSNNYADISGNLGLGANLAPELNIDTAPATVDIIGRGKPTNTDTNSSAVSFNVRFNETVTGVDANDFELVLSNGVTVTNPLFVSGNGNSYTVDVSGISKTDGTLGIRLKNDAAIVDTFNNALVNRTPGENQSYTIDNTAPNVVSITSDKNRLGATNTATITITFSEVPRGFDSFDVGATGGTISNLAVTSDPKVYTATFTPSGVITSDARVTVYQGYSDAAGNAGTALTMASPIAIVAAPVGRITPQNSIPEVLPSGSITLLISFTEDVNAIALDDFTTTGTVTLSGLQRVANSLRNFTVVATAGALEGDFSVGLKANATEDSGLSDNKTAAITPIAIRVDASSSLNNAKSVTVEQGTKTSTSGIADNINDADFFKFTASFTGSVSTLVKADGSRFDPFATAYVQNDDGSYKRLISDDNSGGGTISKMDFNVTAGKTYFIKVESLTKTTGKYIVEITGGEKLADDFGDAQADAASLVVNSSARTTNGTLENNQDKDSFKFTASQTGKASLSFAASTLATGKLEVYSNATTVLKTVAFNGNTEFDVVAGTTYFLIVSSDAGDSGDYSFTISSQASLLFTTTAGVAVAKATNFLPAAGNVDVYTVVAPAPGLLSILVENKDRGIPTQPEFSVYNAAGTRVATNVGASFGPAGSSKQVINFNANAGETYLLKIGETGTFTGSYNITAQADDFGTVSTAPTSLTSGSITGRIELPGDADLFSFNYTNTSGNTAKLQIMQTAASGSALLSGLFVSTNNGSSWIAASQKGTLVELEVDPTVTANLLIWASGASGSSGAYNITTRAVIDDVGNTLTTATTVLLDQSNISTTNATFNYSGDQDVFKVTLNNSGTTLFSVESINDSLFDPKLTITSLSGQVIASDDDSGRGLGSLIVLEGTVGDTFYLTVSGTLNSPNGVAYTLKTGDLPVDDAGNKPDSSAAPLPFNAPVVVNGKSTQVAIENKTIRPAMPGIADFDVFQFTANDTGRFEISVSPAAGSTLAPSLNILGSNGKTVLSSTSASAGKAVFALPYLNKGDKVFVSVSGANSSEGDYTLKVETPVSVVDFFANSYNDTATGLPIGSITLSGTTNAGLLVASNNNNIEAARDVDVFSFTAKNSGPVKVLVSKTTTSTIDTSISIMDASGKVLTSNNDADRDTTNSAAVFEVTANAVYYISVTGDSGTTGQYGIALQDLTPTDSDGFGGDFSTATVLTLDSNFEASADNSIISAGDRDIFELTVDSDGVLAIGLNARASNLDGYLRVYNSDKVLLAEDNDSGTGLDSFISISASAGDVFYIQTGAVGSSIGDYKVWAKLEIDDHANLIGSSATALDVEENFAYDFGTINSTSDVDLFSYTATYTGTIDINLLADEGSSLDTYLFAFDSTGQILIDYNNDISSTDKDSTLSIQVVEGQTYYFKVSGARGTTGDYILDISPVADDVGSTIADATNLPLTVVSSTTAANTSIASTTGSIETKGDTDYYKVSISTAGRYLFKVSKDTASSSGLEDATLEIYSADGELLYKNDDASSTSSDSALELNLAADEIVYVKAAGYGDKIGDYVVEVVYVGAVVVDDYGNTTDNASSFVFDDSSSYSLTGAAIEVAGDFDFFIGVADINGDINITLTTGSTLIGTVKAFISRDGVIVQVASEKATAAGTALSLTFSVAASDEFFIQVSGANSTVGSYDLTVTNTVSTSTTDAPKAVDSSVINSIADELSGQFTKAIADAADGADINEISRNITQKLVDAFIASMGGTLNQTFIILWLDPADFNFSGAGTNVGNQAGSTTNQGSSTSLSTNGALNTVIVSGAQASQYSLNMTGVGSGQVLAGATMVTASGQIVNPVVTIGGSSSSGIASSEAVPKSGLNMVLDFGTNTGGGNGGGNGGGGSNGGDNSGGGTQVGVLPGNGGSADSSSSSSSSSSSASGGGGGGLVSLVNALVQASSGITGTGSGSLLESLAAIAFGGGGTATTVNEKQLERDFGADGQGEGLELDEKDTKEAKIFSSSDVIKATASLVSVSFAEAYKGTDLAIFSTLQAEQQVVSEIANILDKVLPIVVPTEFESSVENILVQTEKTLLEEGKETLTKVANTLTDLVQARLSKKIPAVQPAKNKADAKISTFELVTTNLVEATKNDQVAEDSEYSGDIWFEQELPEGFEEMVNFTSGNRNNPEGALLGSPIVVDDQTNKVAEVAGLIAGALLAPSFLNGALDGKKNPVIGKPKPRKRKS